VGMRSSLGLSAFECALDRYLSIKSEEDYRKYAECFGVLPTQEYNEIWADIEDEGKHGGLYILAAPPGSGKSFLLARLAAEFRKDRRGPVLYESFASVRERFARFVEDAVARAITAIGEWIHAVTGSAPGDMPPEFIGLLMKALRAKRLVRRFPFLVLLDEVPPDYGRIDQLLRSLDALGLDTYVVMTLHEAFEINEVEKALSINGGSQRFGEFKIFPRITLAVGHDDDAEFFIRRLMNGRGDAVAEDVAVEMLKRGLGIRNAVVFAMGVGRQLDGSILGAYEANLSRKIEERLRMKVKTAPPELCRKELKIASRPDLFLQDCTCVEVKVLSNGDAIPPQHSCDKVLYAVVSPERPEAPGALVHVKADVARLVAGFDEVRKRSPQEVADALLGIMADVLAEKIAEQIEPPRTPPPREAVEVCERLAELLKDGKPSRSNLASKAGFKQLVLDFAEKHGGLEDCVREIKAKKKRISAACVDKFAEALWRAYKVETLKIDGTTVALSNFCKEPPAWTEAS